MAAAEAPQRTSGRGSSSGGAAKEGESLDDRLKRLIGEGAPEEEVQDASMNCPPEEVASAPPPVEASAPPPAEEAAAQREPPPQAATAPATTTAAAPATAASVPRPMSNLSPAEKRDASLQAELYSILTTMEHLENAFVRGVVENDEYERHCMQIVAQFKTLQTALRDKIPDVSAFIEEQGMSCPMAKERLLGTGVAATALFHGGSATTSGSAKEALAIHSATEHFITLTNALQIGYKSCFELLPLMQELQSSVVGIPNLPQLPGLERITGWLVTLNNMRATDTLSEDQVKQLTMDADLAYTSLKNWLQDKR